MINKLVLTTNSWGHQKPDNYYLWRDCLTDNIDYHSIVAATTHFSDPEVMFAEFDEILQFEMDEKILKDGQTNYIRIAILNGFYQYSLNYDIDLLIHVNENVYLNEDINPYIDEFMERDELIAAPHVLTESGKLLEAAFFMIKSDGIKKFIMETMCPSVSDKPTLSIEKEFKEIFKDSWWNFLPHIPTIRYYDLTMSDRLDSPFTLMEKDFLNLPIIYSSSFVKQWSEHNDI